MTDTPTTTVFAPPTLPIPPPPAPPRKRHRAVWIVASVLVGAALAAGGFAIAKANSTAKAPSTAPACVRACTPTTPTTPRTTSPLNPSGNPFLTWSLTYAVDVTDALDRLHVVMLGIDDNSTATDILLMCNSGVDVIADISVEPMTLDANAPAEWTTVVDEYTEAFAYCSAGDFVSASPHIEAATTAMKSLNTQLKNYTP